MREGEAGYRAAALQGRIEENAWNAERSSASRSGDALNGIARDARGRGRMPSGNASGTNRGECVECGEVSEWLKEHAWKVCKRLNPASRVRPIRRERIGTAARLARSEAKGESQGRDEQSRP